MSMKTGVPDALSCFPQTAISNYRSLKCHSPRSSSRPSSRTQTQEDLCRRYGQLHQVSSIVHQPFRVALLDKCCWTTDRVLEMASSSCAYLVSLCQYPLRFVYSLSTVGQSGRVMRASSPSCHLKSSRLSSARSDLSS